MDFWFIGVTSFSLGMHYCTEDLSVILICSSGVSVWCPAYSRIEPGCFAAGKRTNFLVTSNPKLTKLCHKTELCHQRMIAKLPISFKLVSTGFARALRAPVFLL